MAALSAVPVAIGAAVAGGSQAVIGVALAAVITCGYLGLAALSYRYAARYANITGLGVLMAGLVLRMTLFGFTLWLLASNGLLTSVSRKAGFGWAVLVIVMAWLAGLVHMHRHSRSFIYDHPRKEML